MTSRCTRRCAFVAWQKEGKFRRYALRREALDAHAPGVLIEDTNLGRHKGEQDA